MSKEELHLPITLNWLFASGELWALQAEVSSTVPCFLWITAWSGNRGSSGEAADVIPRLGGLNCP